MTRRAGREAALFETDQQARARLRRALRQPAEEVLDGWMAAEPKVWIRQNAAELHRAGLTAEDAAALHRRLDSTTAQALVPLINAGRMAALEVRWLHLWAASGLLTAEPEPKPGRGTRRSQARAGRVVFTAWVAAARRYVHACDGDQHLAAAAAGAGLSPEHTRADFEAGKLDISTLEMLAALRDGTAPGPPVAP